MPLILFLNVSGATWCNKGCENDVMYSGSWNFPPCSNWEGMSVGKFAISSFLQRKPPTKTKRLKNKNTRRKILPYVPRIPASKNQFVHLNDHIFTKGTKTATSLGKFQPSISTTMFLLLHNNFSDLQGEQMSVALRLALQKSKSALCLSSFDNITSDVKGHWLWIDKSPMSQLSAVSFRGLEVFTCKQLFVCFVHICSNVPWSRLRVHKPLCRFSLQLNSEILCLGSLTQWEV